MSNELSASSLLRQLAGRALISTVMLMSALVMGCAVSPQPAPDSKLAVSPRDDLQAEPADAVELPDSPVAGWAPVRLPGKRLTRYRPEWQEGRPSWRAEADHSASMWRHALDLAPAQFGQLRFSWWVDRLVPGADLAESGMGDAPARLILAFDGDKRQLSLRNRMMFELAEAMGGEPMPYATLMYVWSNQALPESVLIHPRTDRVRKIVVDQGGADLRQWRFHERNLAQDFQRAFGETPGRLIGVALMTDADNMASTALSWYGDIAIDGLPPLAVPVLAPQAAVP